ncbi:MAG: hypothetical protein ACE5E7_03880 [Anaerolineae bacterium]
MSYQVDQSNKIENYGETILALSNGTSFVIRIPARDKQAVINYLLQSRRTTRKLSRLRIFAVGLYYFLQALPPGEQVIIDMEYPGHEQNIRSMLLNLLWRDKPNFEADRIMFGYVGKKSNAHKKALAVHRGKVKADKIIKADELLKQIIGQ